MRRREQHAHRPASANAVQDGVLRTHLIHNGADVVHPQVEGGHLAQGDWVRDAATPLVEADQPAERGEPLEERGEIRLVPLHLDRVPELGSEHDVDWPVADDLIGDVDVTGLRVAGLNGHGGRVHCEAVPVKGWH